MSDSKEILDKLDLILEKLEKLEKIKAESITVNSGTLNIEAGPKTCIEIKEAGDVTLKAGENTSSISIEICKGDVDTISISADDLLTVSIEAEGDITGDIIAKEN